MLRRRGQSIWTPPISIPAFIPCAMRHDSLACRLVASVAGCAATATARGRKPTPLPLCGTGNGSPLILTWQSGFWISLESGSWTRFLGPARAGVAGYGVPTEVLASAAKATGSVAEVSRWYEVPEKEIEDAVEFEQRLAA